MTHRGRSSRMRRAYSGQRCRGSSAPLPLPATLQGWQGNPPMMASIFPHRATTSAAWTFRTSLHLGTFGQCFARTRWQKGSISTCPAQVHPARSQPRSKAPMPANRLRKRICCSSHEGASAPLERLQPALNSKLAHHRANPTQKPTSQASRQQASVATSRGLYLTIRTVLWSSSSLSALYALASLYVTS